MKILFVGGGTLGPVTPLLATAQALKKLRPNLKFEWIGTPEGPERVIVQSLSIPFQALPVVKWPRSFSWRWLTFPFDWARARSAAARLVDAIRPDAVVTVGGFTAVPVVFAAARRNLPCFTHQLDLIPGLANRRIAAACVSVTTSFEYERRPFGRDVCDEPLATPTRFASDDLPSRHEAARSFGLHPDRPVVFVFGGGTGAQALNELLERTIGRWLEFAQVIHVTGIGRGAAPTPPSTPSSRHSSGRVRSRDDGEVEPLAGAVVRAFLNADGMRRAYAAADLVICRAGIGALSEVAALKKAAIVIPIPDSHQEANARAFEEQDAVIVAGQSSPGFDDEIVEEAKLLIHDDKLRREMGERAHRFFPTDDGTEFAKRILKTLEQGK